MANTLHWDVPFVPMQDKACGQFPGPLPLPVNEALRTQLRLWNLHCRALASRLSKFSFQGKQNLIEHIEKVIDQKPVNLFFCITDLKPKSLGSSDLTSSWPDNLRLNGNFSRSFWECEMKSAGMNSSNIDMLLRHTTAGVEPYTSTSTITQGNWGRKVCGIQEALLRELCVHPIPGLIKR